MGAKQTLSPHAPPPTNNNNDLPQEARPYKADPEVVAMTDLVAAYQANDIRAFEKVLQARAANIMGDGFIRQYVEDLLRNIRTQVGVVVVACCWCFVLCCAFEV
jgi:hypothetical protein